MDSVVDSKSVNDCLDKICHTFNMMEATLNYLELMNSMLYMYLLKVHAKDV